MHLHYILHCLQWSSTWHIFSRYWYFRLLWHALYWLNDVPGPTMLFYLVISCSCDLVIMLHDSFLSRTSHVHYIHVIIPCMHGLIVHDLSSRLFMLLLLPSVLDTAKHIILMSYLLFLHLHILSFTVLFLLCTLAGPLLMDLYIIFFSI